MDPDMHSFLSEYSTAVLALYAVMCRAAQLE
jgi:hypothetical protein